MKFAALDEVRIIRRELIGITLDFVSDGESFVYLHRDYGLARPFTINYRGHSLTLDEAKEAGLTDWFIENFPGTTFRDSGGIAFIVFSELGAAILKLKTEDAPPFKLTPNSIIRPQAPPRIYRPPSSGQSS